MKRRFLLYFLYCIPFICFFELKSQSLDSIPIQVSLLTTGFVVPDSNRTPDVILIHSSYCPTLEDSFNLDCILDLYKKYKVSAHYIIDRKGVVFQLVKEENISHHGGKGVLPDGSTKINTRSIGIELINTKVSAYTDLQYQCLVRLVKNIQYRWKINYLLGHKDVSPSRKTDPWNFDWARFWNEMNCEMQK
jgi:N-acetyl-anhydromuramyl-L-alanine amidase AmpD